MTTRTDYNRFSSDSWAFLPGDKDRWVTQPLWIESDEWRRCSIHKNTKVYQNFRKISALHLSPHLIKPVIQDSGALDKGVLIESVGFRLFTAFADLSCPPDWPNLVSFQRQWWWIICPWEGMIHYCSPLLFRLAIKFVIAVGYLSAADLHIMYFSVS